MHADAQQTVGGEFDAHRFGGGVQGGFGHAIGEHGAIGVGADRAQHRGHVDDDGALDARLRGRLRGGGGFEQRQEGLGGGADGVVVRFCVQIWGDKFVLLVVTLYFL